MKLRLLGAVICLLVLSIGADAAIITHGRLVTDDTTNYITDISSGRRYTRFDAFSLTYTETLTAISSGGAFEGWSIVTASIADEFYQAALYPVSSSCLGSQVHGVTCGVIQDWEKGDFGISHVLSSSDYFAYINDGADPSRPFGLAQIGQFGYIFDHEYWSDAAFLDSGPTDLLLYVEPVPIPPAVYLFASGLIGLVGVARRQYTQ